MVFLIFFYDPTSQRSGLNNTFTKSKLPDNCKGLSNCEIFIVEIIKSFSHIKWAVGERARRRDERCRSDDDHGICTVI